MDEAVTMPSNAQEFCLRWNNFHTSLVSALDSFKNDLDFVDVTLACEGQYLKAHKMLLSACSVFFRDLLKANPCPHPIIILPPEVRFVDLEKMLRFIYQGEVNVHQESLSRFLKTAEMLKIRGLADDNDKQKVSHSSSPRPPESGGGNERGRDSTSVSPKRPRLSLDTQLNTVNDALQALNDDNSRLSGADSDSEMIPVKQEMIELKDCDFETVESDSFLQNSLNAASQTAQTSSANNNNAQSSHPVAPPPPGPLLPSYVPPPLVKAADGLTRSSAHPVGGLIRRFMEECLQLPDPAPLLATYSGLEGTPHFQLLRSVAKEWSYCKNATQNYSTLGGSNKRQRATSRLIETFESIDGLRNQLSQSLHKIIVIEITSSGIVQKICKAEQAHVQQQQLAQQQQVQQQGNNSESPVNIDVVNRDFVIMEIEGVTTGQQEEFKTATDVMKQLRKLYFDQSRRLAVRISQLKKGRQHAQERLNRQQQTIQQSFIHQTVQTLQQIQHQSNPQHQLQTQQQISPDGTLHLGSHGQLTLQHLHQPWSD